MKKIILIMVFFISSVCPIIAQELLPSKEINTFVIVHGATGGGWDWKTIDQRLSANGHTVYRPTLTGLGEKYHLNNSDINLTTHINDIVNLIVFEDLHNIILVGHSYGGMVITGVMDRIPERIKHVTFLDAMVPEDGMSATEGNPLISEFKVVDGMVHFPGVDQSLPFPRDVIQSFKTLTEPVSYKNPAAIKLNVTYVALIPKELSEAGRAEVFLQPSWVRAKKRHWTMRTFEGGHNVHRHKPIEFTAMLEDTVNDRNSF